VAPDYTPAIRGTGTIALRRGSVPDALALVAPLAQQFRTNLDLQALHAELLVRAKRYDDAWAVGRRALECDERHVPTLKAIIRASQAQGRDDLAESVLAQALAIRDADPELHFIQGQIFENEPGRIREAIEEFRKAVNLRPDYAEARMALGKLELAAGNYREAVAHFEAIDRVVPGSIQVKLNLADAYRSSRRWEDAQRTFDEVLKMNPNMPEAHFNLGLMYQTQGFDLPGVDELVALGKAKQAFSKYRSLMGAKLRRGDPSEEYLGGINRRMQRIEEARRRQAEEARRREQPPAPATDGAPPAEKDDDVVFFD
jgi:tetratricopeptide (TPR) repeat protein